MNPNMEVFKYCGPRMSQYYNQFFNPNICHVCKLVDERNLILCDQCCLISYCSEEHKMMDRACHLNICMIIAQVVKVKPDIDSRTYINWDHWIQSREELVELIQGRFESPMEPYMQQMILWSKSCMVCHQQAELRVCKRCFSINYCNEHKKIFEKSHNVGICDELVLWFNINIETISGNTTDIRYDFLLSIDESEKWEEMLEFCMDYLLMPRENIDWLAKDYVQSDYLSGPLTVYFIDTESMILYALQDENVVIHIIVADSVGMNSVDVNSIPAWEILLHLLPNMRNLSIVLIGPKLTDGYKRHTLCAFCTNKNYEFSSFMFSMSYHNFILYTTFRIPDIIVGFHIQFGEGDISLESLKAIQPKSCPLILGFSCKQKALNGINKIKRGLNIMLDPCINHTNNFGGLAPHRDLETGETYFRNKHVVMFECLMDIDAESESN